MTGLSNSAVLKVTGLCHRPLVRSDILSKSTKDRCARTTYKRRCTQIREIGNISIDTSSSLESFKVPIPRVSAPRSCRVYNSGVVIGDWFDNII